MTLRGMQLRMSELGLCHNNRDHILDWINVDQPWIPEKTQACNTETGMEDIDHVPGSVSEPALIHILAYWSITNSTACRYTLPGIVG